MPSFQPPLPPLFLAPMPPTMPPRHPTLFPPDTYTRKEINAKDDAVYAACKSYVALLFSMRARELTSAALVEISAALADVEAAKASALSAASAAASAAQSAAAPAQSAAQSAASAAQAAVSAAESAAAEATSAAMEARKVTESQDQASRLQVSDSGVASLVRDSGTPDLFRIYFTGKVYDGGRHYELPAGLYSFYEAPDVTFYDGSAWETPHDGNSACWLRLYVTEENGLTLVIGRTNDFYHLADIEGTATHPGAVTPQYNSSVPISQMTFVRGTRKTGVVTKETLRTLASACSTPEALLAALKEISE